MKFSTTVIKCKELDFSFVCVLPFKVSSVEHILPIYVSLCPCNPRFNENKIYFNSHCLQNSIRKIKVSFYLPCFDSRLCVNK